MLEHYEDYVSAAIVAREQADAAFWQLGDLANDLFGETVSGRPATANNTLKDFAKDIGVGKNSLSDYKAIAAFFPKSTRADFVGLSYSQFRAVWRHCSVRPKENVEAILIHIANEGYTVDQTWHWLKCEDMADMRTVINRKLTAAYSNLRAAQELSEHNGDVETASQVEAMLHYMEGDNGLLARWTG